MAKGKNLDKKITYWYEVGRADLWWEYFVSRVTPKGFWKKNVRLEEASFFDLVPHLRPYISPNIFKTVSVTNNSIHIAYKLHAIIKVYLWMLNVSGLVVFMT